MSQVLALYEDAGHLDYIGEPVSQLEHAAQTADGAVAAGYGDDVVCAAFLHDVGHLCDAPAARMGCWGAAQHETLGAQFVRELGFGERVARLVAGHVDAKRYLTFTQPDYLRRLSEASKATLHYQGGPMTADEARLFEADPVADLILELRTWDEAAKVPGKPVKLADYAAVLRRHWDTEHAAGG